MKNASRDRERIIKQLFGLQKVLDDVRQLVGDSENDDEENDGGENRPSSRFPAITDLIPRCRGELESLKGILEENLRRKGRMQALIWPLKEADVNKTVDNLGKFQHLLMSALSVDQTYVTIVTFDTILIFFGRRLALEIHTDVEALQEQSTEISQSIEQAGSRIGVVAGATQDIQNDVQSLRRQNAQISQAMEQAKLRMSHVDSAS